MIISKYLFLAPQQDVFVNLDGKFYLGNPIIAATSIVGKMNNAVGVPCLGWSLVSYVLWIMLVIISRIEPNILEDFSYFINRQVKPIFSFT